MDSRPTSPRRITPFVDDTPLESCSGYVSFRFASLLAFCSTHIHHGQGAMMMPAVRTELILTCMLCLSCFLFCTVRVQLLEQTPQVKHNVKCLHYAQSSPVKSMNQSSVSYVSAIVTTERK